MEEADIALLRKVPIAFLKDDKYGRGVLYADRSRVKPKDRRSMVRTTKQRRTKLVCFFSLGHYGIFSHFVGCRYFLFWKMRAIFYILTVMMESEDAQKNGVVLVANTKVRREWFQFHPYTF
jgi:hypothetical protein